MTAEVLARTGHANILSIITLRCHGLFCRLLPEAAAHKALHLAVLQHKGIYPEPTWRRPRIDHITPGLPSLSKTQASLQISCGR